MRPVLALLAAALFAPPLLAAKPNVVLVMVDDFGYECVTANGGQSYRTPHLDRLAAGGVRFEQCHVQPLCTPTRVQLMTGKFNVRNYLNFGTLVRTETTFAHLLKKAGYATGVCGKWQLGTEPDSPRHFGFDDALLWHHTRRVSRYANPGLDRNGVPEPDAAGKYGPDLVNDFALDFVTKHKERPFFLYYPMMLTHNPFDPTPDSPDWNPSEKTEGGKQNTKHFADMTAYADKLIGKLDAKLGELGVRDNTLLIVLGDNGTLPAVTSRLNGTDYKGGKGTTTARGTRVPLIASWPAAAKAGRVCPDLISSADVLPTICAAAGADVPAGLDGVSFLPQLRGEPGTPREWLYHWYSPRLRDNDKLIEWAFDHRYKLYRTGEFYDLTADPFEATPLTVASLTGPAADGAKKLQGVLDQHAGVRPAALDQGAAKKKKKAKE